MRNAQVARLQKIRASRDEQKCVAALKALGEAARNGTGNLLTLAVEATRARATVGEISSALEGVYGRYQATIRSISAIVSPRITRRPNPARSLNPGCAPTATPCALACRAVSYITFQSPP